jgi:hypothetical protein
MVTRLGSGQGSLIVLSGLSAFILLLVSLPASDARGATATCGDLEYNFMGRGVNPSTYQPAGAVAGIEARPAALCSDDDVAFSTAWAMLSGDGGGQMEYAQIGYMHKAEGVSPRFFYQWSEGLLEDFENVYWGSPVYGTTYWFKVSRYPADGFIHLLLNNSEPAGDACDETHVCVTTFDPYEEWSGTEGDFYAEIIHPSSDMVGTLSSKTDFEEIRVKNPADDTWYYHDYTTGYYVSQYCWYHSEDVTDSAFRVWTDPLNHAC